MKAFSYLRVSGKGQVDGDGFPRQRAKISAWAKANRCAIVREFVEEGISGTTEAIDRPALTAMLTEVLSNGVRLILVERADRLARDSVVSELLLRQLQSSGVTVIEAEGGNDLTAGNDSNPTAKLVRQIMASIAEFDKCSIVLKLRAARAKIRLKDGRCEGRKPFGHFEGEQAALDRMRALRRKPKGGERMSFAKVAATLDAEGFQSRSGKPWSAESVRKIIGR